MAVSLPEEVREWAGQVSGRLSPKNPSIKWVWPHNLHITLKFMGWVDEIHVAAAKAALASIASQHGRGKVGLEGLGAFPRASRARVVWIGLEDPTPLLAPMAKDLDGAFEELGVAAENRPFVPHMTVGRMRVPAPVDLDVGLPLPPEPFPVERIDLYRSHLSPKGARHERLASEYLRT